MAALFGLETNTNGIVLGVVLGRGHTLARIQVCDERLASSIAFLLWSTQTRFTPVGHELKGQYIPSEPP